MGNNFIMSSFQKLTVLSCVCVCVCVALLLPKLLLPGGGRRDPASAEGAGLPPMLHRKSVSALNSARHSEAVIRARGGTAAAGKSNLTGQIIPVYGFGILLYIIYIIYKITQRGNSNKTQERRFTTTTSENMKRKITDFELFQLQERLKETEEVMERIVSRAQTLTHREECVSVDQEKVLLLQLRELTRVMQEGRLVDAVLSQTPECHLFPDDLEETLKDWSSHCCPVHHQTDEQAERADRRVEETEGADRRVEETEGADRRVEETDGADRWVEETEQADRWVEEETEGADRWVEETEGADRWVEETEQADRQTDSCESNECSDGGAEEICMEMTEQLVVQRWNTAPSGDHVIRHRSGRGTSRGTEPRL